jgi:rare lipoprotein A
MMTDRAERRDEKGLSARYLILVFLMGVAACAVFFSLGFLVGYNERSSNPAATAEEVVPGGVIPPTVNPPLETAPATSSQGNVPAARELPTEHVSVTEPAAKPSKERTASPQRSAAAARAIAKASPAKPAGRDPRAGEVGYTVQVAASSAKQDAEKVVKELRARGFDVFVVTPQASDAKDNLYRIQVGPYATREEAVRVRDRIAKEGFKPFIKR